MSSEIQQRLFDIKQAATYLNRSVRAMRGLIYSGQIPIIRPPGSRSKIYVDPKDLEKYIEKSKTVYA
jgi:excisionase family DNA binding protein